MNAASSIPSNLDAEVEHITELIIMLAWVELNLTELKLIKPMLTKCMQQREENALFKIHFHSPLF